MSPHAARFAPSTSETQKSSPSISDATGVYQYYLLTQAYEPNGNTPHYVNSNGETVNLPEGVCGNFAGLTDDKLDAIKKMGMSTIWLSPVYAANPEKPGYTYNATNYKEVNPIYGSADDLKAMIDRIHGKGMKVIMDEVFNHTGNDHAWFQASRDPNHLRSATRIRQRLAWFQASRDPNHLDHDKYPDHDKYKDYYVWQDPIRVGAADTNMDSALKNAYGLDEQLRTAILEDIAKGGDGKAAMPKIEVPLRDSHGEILHKKNPKTGQDLEDIATVDVLPVMDWSKMVVTDTPGHVDGIPTRNGSGNSNDRIWIALPKRDENGKILYPPNNYLNCGGDRAWDYDDKRGQLYCHLFHDTMPDLNIGNPAVNNELKEVGKYWRDEFGTDGFRMDAARVAGTHKLLLASGLTDGGKQAEILAQEFPQTADMSLLERQLFVAGMTSNPPNTLRELFKERGWENPFPTETLVKEIHEKFPQTKNMSEEDMLMFVGTLDLPVRAATETGNLFAGGFRQWLHPRDIAQKAGLDFWADFAAEMKSGKEGFSILHEFGDDPRMAKIYQEAGAGDYFYLSSFDNTNSIVTLKRDVQDTLDSMPHGIGVNWTPDNHDTTRFVTRMGFDPACPKDGHSEAECIAGQKLLMQFISHLPGNVTMYNGTELGVGTPYGREIKAQEGRDPLNYFGSATCGNPDAQTHDFARAAYPWTPGDFDKENMQGGQGRFFKTPDSWEGRDYETQNADPNSVLHTFKRAMQERINSPILNQPGEMKFLNYDFGNEALNNNVLLYTRTNGAGQTQLFVDNFTGKEVTVNLTQLQGQNRELDALIVKRTSMSLGSLDTMKVAPYGEQSIGGISRAKSNSRGV